MIIKLCEKRKRRVNNLDALWIVGGLILLFTIILA